MRDARLLLFVFLFLPLRTAASCGSTSCPIELHALDQWQERQFTLDLSFQYIDQDQPRIGTRRAAVGKIPSDHAEMRTINRLTTLQLGYRPSPRLQLSLTLPYVSRAHEHLDEALNEVERWDLSAAGDVALQARYVVAGHAGDQALSLVGSIKAPTGARHETNRNGEQAEVTIQPGSGSVDGLIGLSFQGSAVRDTILGGPFGHVTRIPYFVSATYRRNGRGVSDYRRGDEVQINAGTEYPIARLATALLQVNGRVLQKDTVGKTAEDPALTGGRFLFVSPGLRLSLARRLSLYGFVQLPVYQRVNGIQLTARANYLAGLQARF
jgi:hypothetical protein